MATALRTTLTVGATLAALAGVLAWVRGAPAENAGAAAAAGRAHDGHATPRRSVAPHDALLEPAAPAVDPRIAAVPTDAIRAELHAPLVLTGTIAESNGAPPEREGTTCRLGVDRADDGARCRVVLECGHTRLYGAPILHDTPCGFTADGALATLADDATNRTDHDPSIVLAAAQSTLAVSDDTGGSYGEFSLVIRLDGLAP